MQFFWFHSLHHQRTNLGTSERGQPPGPNGLLMLERPETKFHLKEGPKPLICGRRRGLFFWQAYRILLDCQIRHDPPKGVSAAK